MTATDHQQRWQERHPGERVSIAVNNGGYLEQNGRCHFNFGAVLMVTEAVDQWLGSRIIVGLDNGDLTWRYAKDVHDEWYYWPEEVFRQRTRDAYNRMIFGDTGEEEAE